MAASPEKLVARAFYDGASPGGIDDDEASLKRTADGEAHSDSARSVVA
ncbi:MAG TPA: hypothetical protein VIX59_19320 [Candidatus Binataceae bacterium]